MKLTLKKTLKATMLITTAMLGLSSTALASTFDDAVKLYEQGNYQEAARIFKDYAKQGDADAQLYLGLMYAKGQGVAQDYRQAAKWYQKAAEQGNADAQFVVGSFYYLGTGVEKNIKTAKKWIEKGCNNGNQNACDILSKLR